MQNIYTLFKKAHPHIKALTKNQTMAYVEQAQACMTLADKALQEAERRDQHHNIYKKARYICYLDKSYRWYKKAENILAAGGDYEKAKLARLKAEALPELKVFEVPTLLKGHASIRG